MLKYSTILGKLDDGNVDLAVAVGEMLLKSQIDIAGKLCIPENEFNDIMSEKRKVKQIKITYENPMRMSSRTYRTSRGRYVVKMVAIVVIILIPTLFSISLITRPGLADSIRTSVISIFEGDISNSVETVVYNKDMGDLEGQYLPLCLPQGFHYASHARAKDSNLLYVMYVNDTGESIEYYYYPRGAGALYDNEYTEFYDLNYRGGLMHVGRRNQEATIMYFLNDDAFIQLDFESHVSDKTLRYIAENIRRNN